MIDFNDNVSWSLFDHIHMVEELEAFMGRKVDLITKKALEKSKNPFKKKIILDGSMLYHG